MSNSVGRSPLVLGLDVSSVDFSVWGLFPDLTSELESGDCLSDIVSSFDVGLISVQ